MGEIAEGGLPDKNWEGLKKTGSIRRLDLLEQIRVKCTIAFKSTKFLKPALLLSRVDRVGRAWYIDNLRCGSGFGLLARDYAQLYRHERELVHGLCMDKRLHMPVCSRAPAHII